jgi:protease I
MELEGNHVAVLVDDHYADLELWYPALRLQEAGAEVVIVGPETRRYTSQHGLPIQAESRAEQVSADDFDAIIIPGGAVPDAIRRDPAMAALVHDMEQRGKVVAAISDADQHLTSSRDAAAAHTERFFGVKARVQQDEGAFAESTVLREGNVITACPPVNLPAFCRMIIVALMAANSTPSEHLKDYG